MSDFREGDVVARTGDASHRGVVRFASAGVDGAGVLWDAELGVSFERFKDITFVSRPGEIDPTQQITIAGVPAPVRPITLSMSIRFARRTIPQLREQLLEQLPAYLTLEQGLVIMLGGQARLARALFESDEAVLQFVDRVSDALLGDEPADDEERRKLDRRVARAMQIAWDRNELGARAHYEGLVARLVGQLGGRST